MSKKTYEIKVAGSGAVLGTQVGHADNFWLRLKGLMGRKTLPQGEGLLIVPCNSIHMVGMKFSIDALFLAKDGTVLKVASDCLPGSFGPMVKGSRAVLELPSGTAESAGVKEGDRLEGLPAL